MSQASQLMIPVGADKDEDVLKAVETWMDEYHEATSRGRDHMSDAYRIAALKKIVTPRYKDRMDLRNYTSFEQALAEVTRWATVKQKESKSASTSMDIGKLSTETEWWDLDPVQDSEGLYVTEEVWMPHPSTGEIMAFTPKGTGKGGKNMPKGGWLTGGGGKGKRTRTVGVATQHCTLD